MSEQLGVSFEWSKFPAPPKFIYTARQVRLYRLLAHLPKAKDGRSVRPWTLGMLWFKCRRWIGYVTGYSAWHAQTRMEQYITTQAKLMSDKIDQMAIDACYLQTGAPR